MKASLYCLYYDPVSRINPTDPYEEFPEYLNKSYIRPRSIANYWYQPGSLIHSISKQKQSPEYKYGILKFQYTCTKDESSIRTGKYCI